MNAMQPVFFEELDSLVTRAIGDDNVRVILLHGGDSKGFTAGLDLTSVGSVLPGADATETTAEKSAKVCVCVFFFFFFSFSLFSFCDFFTHGSVPF
jgi:enoyl-CoA hydratase/carnithine racemase